MYITTYIDYDEFTNRIIIALCIRDAEIHQYDEEASRARSKIYVVASGGAVLEFPTILSIIINNRVIFWLISMSECWFDPDFR